MLIFKERNGNNKLSKQLTGHCVNKESQKFSFVTSLLNFAYYEDYFKELLYNFTTYSTNFAVEKTSELFKCSSIDYSFKNLL